MIGIIDYGMGNLQSVSNAVSFLGADFKIITQSKDFSEITHLIIPGVGAFAEAMQNITERNFIQPIKEFAATGKPVLGICLGMQLLADSGNEPYETKGLGLIKGRVEKFKTELRLPHVGWNGIDLSVEDHPLFEGVKKQADFYFVHSYHFLTEEENNVLAKCNYGFDFNAIVYSKNIIGIQFHPEKSQKQGLKILENFLNQEV
jgi:imidazole glycerol-phosphate synthase subunit HisH